jgi:hypothetical protein
VTRDNEIIIIIAIIITAIGALAQPVVPNDGLTMNNQIRCYRSWHTLTFGSGFERSY